VNLLRIVFVFGSIFEMVRSSPSRTQTAPPPVTTFDGALPTSR
jgi:hypothetical protein